MSSLDATFLAIEDAVNHMHIGSVGVFEGPPPTYAEIERLVASKLPLVPRYRQKARLAPASIGRPVWIDDPHFHLGYHLRHSALPAPGGDDELRRLVGRVMSQQLDRHRPLWETWMIEGLDDGCWALITKVHHCMVDGIAGTDLLSVVLDRSPEGSPPVVDDWQPSPEPGTAELAWHSVSGLARVPFTLGARAAGLALHPATTAQRVVEVGRGATAMGGLLRSVPGSSLTGPIGPHRRWDHARAEIADVRVIRHALGGTLNDVVLAAVTRGFRDLLASRGESLDGRTVRTLVPVSLRTADARGVFDNRVSAMFAELPVATADPIERLEGVRAELDRLKEAGAPAAAGVVSQAGDLSPPLLTAIFSRIAVHQQSSVETVTTNVPGPREPLYACGRRMAEAFPYVPLAGKVRIGVAIFSYQDALHFGVTGDYDGAPDLEVLSRGIEAGFAELLAVSADSPAVPKPRPAASGLG